MKVIVINGSNSTGKDKFARLFSEHYFGKVSNISSVDHIKNAAKEYFGWDGKKSDDSRKFLSDLKNLCREYNNGPFQYVVDKIKEKNCDVNFVHCREPEEIQKFKEYYKDDFISIILKKDDRYVADNDADKNVSNYNYDFEIDNNSDIDNLEKQVINFISKCFV